MNSDDVQQILADGYAQREAIRMDSRYSENHKQALGDSVFQAALENARTMAAQLRTDAEQRLAAADSQLQIELQRHEQSIDAGRLTALQTEMAALAAGDFATFSAAVEAAARRGDALALRAATVAFPILRERTTSHLSPLRQHAGAIENLAQTITAERQRLEPETLQALRAAQAAAWENAQSLDVKLRQINERTARAGGPGLLAEQPHTVQFFENGKMRFTSASGWW